MAATAFDTVLQWVGIVTLVSLSALFAGLTLGIMSLDITGLEIVIASGSAKESEYAKKIYPIRSRGNLLLCTLLLGNVSVNALLSILMADLTSGLIGFLLSTFIIVVFGEIVPQAACSRHGLAVGAHTAWIMYFFLFLFFPFAYPISYLLDWWLGREMGTIYNRNELKKLLDIHAIHTESGVSRRDVMILSGVLDYAAKKVELIMTPIDSVFMLDMESKLDLKLLTHILEKGHSRIPVYEKDRSNIVSSMLVKDLAIVNPEEGLSLRSFLGFYGRQLPKLKYDMTLDNVLNEFKTGKSHMAIVVRPTVVTNDDGSKVGEEDVTIGVVTLEDVLEEILQDEIMDEKDINRQKKSEDSGYKKYASFKDLTHTQLSPQQITAIISFLSTSLPEFSKKLINEEAFKYLLRNSTILEYDRPPKGDKLLYTRGLPDQFFTLVLQGKLDIRAGSDAFYSECGPFSYLGLDALKFDSFIPDFNAKVISHVQLVRIKKKTYDTALQMTSTAQLQTTNAQRKAPKPPKPQIPTDRNFSDSIDFVERKDSNNTSSSSLKDKNNAPIALKSFSKGKSKREEKQSLMNGNDFSIEEDAFEPPAPFTFEAEEERLKRIIGDGDAIVTSSSTQNDGGDDNNNSNNSNILSV